MARTLATLPAGARITDYIRLGVITKTFPFERVRAMLASTGKAIQRQRGLPTHVAALAPGQPGWQHHGCGRRAGDSDR